MTGTVVVQGAAAPPPTDTVEARTPAGGLVWLVMASAALLGAALGARRFGFAAGRR